MMGWWRKQSRRPPPPPPPPLHSPFLQLAYEEEILRNPYSLRHWWSYLIDRKGKMTLAKRQLVYERALRALPGSYKLWKAYLDERRDALRDTDVPPSHPSFESLNKTYERALVTMHKMPRIWLDYLELLVEQRRLTRIRRAFDRALAALPITQHDRVWPKYLDFVTIPGVPEETAQRVYRRYLKLEPEHAEEYVTFLQAKGRWGEAARMLADLVNDDGFKSLAGKSKHAMWLELCSLVTQHPDHVTGTGLRVEAIIRSGIRRYSDEVGRLWTSLADYFIQKGLFEKARDVYEEGLASVLTVRDFSLVYDALVQFEESLITASMEAEEQAEDTKMTDHKEDEDDADTFLLAATVREMTFGHQEASSLLSVDLRLARLERLMERRPELLSSVVLRQNPHNVHEWHKRAKLFASDPTKQITTYTEAVRTVDVKQAVGKPHTLWLAFSRLYETHGDLTNARIVLEKATQAEYMYVDDLAHVWCAWVELELRHDCFTQALQVLRRATEPHPEYAELQRRKLANPGSGPLPVHVRVHRTLRLWNLLVDLEESLGSLDSVKAAYYRMLDQKIATPQTVLNFASLLQEKGYYEEAFRVYERGVQTFMFPNSREIWLAYLQKFIARYGGDKLERTRDLFEEALVQCPPKDSREFYILYADLEEAHGLGRRAMDVYDRAVQALPPPLKKSVLDVYLSKASEMMGIGKVREVFERAIEAEGPAALPASDCRDLCQRYATLEVKLGEVDRARSLWTHGAAMANPAQSTAYWAAWNAFEVKHGNEDTFREMLRIKRSVAASFSTLHFNAENTEEVARGLLDQVLGAGGGEVDPMAAMEAAASSKLEVQQGTKVAGFVSAGLINPEKKQHETVITADGGAGANGEEIDVGEEEEEGNDDEGELMQKSIPAAVLGGLASRK